MITRESIEKAIAKYVRVHAEYMYWVGIYNGTDREADAERKEMASNVLSVLDMHNEQAGNELSEMVLDIADEEGIEKEDLVDWASLHEESCKIAEKMRNANGIYMNGNS